MTLGGFEGTGQAAHEGRLTGSISSQDRYANPGAKGDINVGQYHRTARVGGVQVLGRQQDLGTHLKILPVVVQLITHRTAMTMTTMILYRTEPVRLMGKVASAASKPRLTSPSLRRLALVLGLAGCDNGIE